jgi:hypothetical protein
MMYVLYAGLARRTDRRAAMAGTVVAGETLIFAANGFRCPLTKLAENFGAADGSVTDIWLPRWLAHNLPALHVPLVAAAAYLNGRNLHERNPTTVTHGQPTPGQTTWVTRRDRFPGALGGALNGGVGAAMNRPVATAMRGGVAVMEAEADIGRSAGEVFDYASDPANEPEWNIRMKRIEKLTGGPVGVGARYRMKFTQGPPAVSECVRFERPAFWELAGGSKILSSGFSGRVVSRGDGSRLLLRMQIRPRGSLRWALPLVRRRMRRELARDVATIKARLEGAAPASAGAKPAKAGERGSAPAGGS